MCVHVFYDWTTDHAISLSVRRSYIGTHTYTHIYISISYHVEIVPRLPPQPPLPRLLGVHPREALLARGQAALARELLRDPARLQLEEGCGLVVLCV